MAIMTAKKSKGIEELPAVNAMEHPTYAAEWAKLQEVRAQLKQLDREFSEMENRAAEDKRRSRQDSAAEAILAGKPVESTNATLQSRKTELWDKRQLLRRAIAIQERRVAEVHSSVCREIAEAHLPAYRDLMQKMADTAAELGRLGDLEDGFRDQLHAAGVSFTGVIRPMPIPGFTLEDEWSRLNIWLRELKETHGIEPKG